MQASMDSEMVRERLDELGEELQTVASLVQLSIKNQQHEGIDEASGAFDCSGDAERKFEVMDSCLMGLLGVGWSRPTAVGLRWLPLWNAVCSCALISHLGVLL